MAFRLDRFLYRKKSVGLRAMLFPLALASHPYRWAVRLRALAYDRGAFTPKRLPCPVISVGNLTVGGTGKTPLVMFLARHLVERGIPVSVLTRGYKGRKGAGAVVTDGKTILLSPEEAGDEPYLMANLLTEVPILVGKDRWASGQKALRDHRVRGVILDDGYQHLQLHRDLNILLIDVEIGFGDGSLLPRGILREPLSSIRRADLVLLTKVKDPDACSALESELRRRHPSVPIFHSRYEILGLVGPKREQEPFDPIRGKRVLALSGIGNPHSFLSLLRTEGANVVNEVSFPDHHAYTAQDVRGVEGMAKEVDWVITTEKDLVKLRRLKIDALPLRALRIEPKIWEEKEFLKRVMALFAAPRKP
jgi:tetraacyldisaccharide 4'-kinase